MIAHLAGTVSSVAPDGAVIDVGGVGLLVQCTPDTLAGLRPGETTRVATSLVVREDSLTLYGFGSEDERVIFELVQTVSGVGPRLALAMLAVLTPDELRRAVAAEDLAALTAVPGIGRKGAQRIVLELAGRLGAPIGQPAATPTSVRGPGRRPAAWQEQVRAGLVNLGWQGRDADQAIAAIEPELVAAASAGPGGDRAGGSLPGSGVNGGSLNGGSPSGGSPSDGSPSDGSVTAGSADAGPAAAGRGAGRGLSGDRAAKAPGTAGTADGAGEQAAGGGRPSGADEADIDVAVALRAALRVLGRS